MAKMKSPFRCKVRCTGGYPYYNSPPAPKGNTHKPHGGEDYVPTDKSVEANWSLYSPCDGYVYKSRDYGDYGQYIVIIADNGYWVLMAHMARRDVKAGQRVTLGQQVGVAGNTGHSTGRHLHIEVSDMRNVKYSAITWYTKLKEHRVKPSDYIDFNDYDPSGGFDVKTWKNGSTPEKVYSTTTACKAQGKDNIGSLAPREVCNCYGIVENCYIVAYKVDGTAAYKTGFVKYSGGVKP